MTVPAEPILPGLSVRPITDTDGAALVLTNALGSVSLYLSREDWQTLRNAAGVVVERLGAEAFRAASQPRCAVCGDLPLAGEEMCAACLAGIVEDTLALAKGLRRLRPKRLPVMPRPAPDFCPVCGCTGCDGGRSCIERAVL